LANASRTGRNCGTGEFPYITNCPLAPLVGPEPEHPLLDAALPEDPPPDEPLLEDPRADELLLAACFFAADPACFFAPDRFLWALFTETWAVVDGPVETRDVVPAVWVRRGVPPPASATTAPTTAKVTTTETPMPMRVDTSLISRDI
jgi:hypothetical protein